MSIVLLVWMIRRLDVSESVWALGLWQDGVRDAVLVGEGALGRQANHVRHIEVLCMPVAAPHQGPSRVRGQSARPVFLCSPNVPPRVVDNAVFENSNSAF